MAESKRAQALEPLWLSISYDLSEKDLAKGDLNAAFEQWRRAIDLDPYWYFLRQQLALVPLTEAERALSYPNAKVFRSERLGARRPAIQNLAKRMRLPE